MARVKRWDILIRITQTRGYRRMVEIGVKSGRNIDQIAKRCPDIEIWGIDPWRGTEGYIHWSNPQISRHEREFDEVAARHAGRIYKVKGFSVEASPYFEDGSLDLVFIDGDHRYEQVKSDINAWLPKVREGGMIAGHDYGNTNQHGDRFIGVDQAVNEAFPDRFRLDQDHVWLVDV